MRDFTKRAAEALKSWEATQDPTVAEIVVGHVEVHDAHDRFEPIRVDLREISAEDFRHVLGSEAAARSGSGAIARGLALDDTDRLRYAAGRVTHLLSRASTRTGNLRWSQNTAALLEALQQVAESSSELIDEATGAAGEELAAGRVVPAGAAETTSLPAKRPEAIEKFEILRNSAATQLTEAAQSLEQLVGLVDSLQRPLGAVTPADGPTLVDEAIVEFKVEASMSGIGKYHVRVFDPGEDTKPLVVIGNLSDSQSTSVLNSIDEIAAATAEVLLEDKECCAVEWAPFAPAEMYPVPPTTKNLPTCERRQPEHIELVCFEEGFRVSDSRLISHADLEDLAGGPVRFWHTSNYTSTELVSTGVRVVHPDTRKRVAAPERPAQLKMPAPSPAESAHTVAPTDDPQTDVRTGRKRRRWSLFKSGS